ncbi:hypothetical protein ABZ565_35085 [Streptomyces sp. NPDC016469]|uniref:hypothetical protein n=1 Tax=Streptomyces sp. NPDC016469 TaxID=3157191 RepID=UPI00340EC2F2
MLWPALRALAHGHLAADQVTRLLHDFALTERVRTAGPGAAQSIAHRSLIDGESAALVLDLARTGDSGWVFTLFHTGQQPAAATVEEYRERFREAVSRNGLTLIQVEPPTSADEVLLTSVAADKADSPFGARWDPVVEELSRLWPHLGLAMDAPREVKTVKLRELMLTSAWPQAPEPLRREAEAFLHGA